MQRYDFAEVAAAIGFPHSATPFEDAPDHVVVEVTSHQPPPEAAATASPRMTEAALSALCDGRDWSNPILLHWNCSATLPNANLSDPCIAVMDGLTVVQFMRACRQHAHLFKVFQNVNFVDAEREASKRDQTVRADVFVTPEVLITILGVPEKIGIIPFKPKDAPKRYFEAGTMDMDIVEPAVKTAADLESLCADYLTRGHGLLMYWECAARWQQRENCTATTYTHASGAPRVWEVLRMCERHRSDFASNVEG